jgi:hypothetical protein
MEDRKRMKGTAKQDNQHFISMHSRFSEPNFSSTSSPDSMANILMYRSFYIQDLVFEWEEDQIYFDTLFTNRITLDNTSFELFINTIEKPPEPNARLKELFQLEQS